MSLYGAGKYTCELVDGWAKLPEGWLLLDIGCVRVDSQDRIHVFSRSSHPVLIFNREGNLLDSWGEGIFQFPHGICIGTDGCIYTTDPEGPVPDHSMRKFSPERKLLMTLGSKGQPSDTGYVECIDVFSGIATITRGGPPFNLPTGVALSSLGEIYVSDGYGNARVHKFTPDGTLLFSWGEPGRAPGQFRLPHYLWVDKQDRVWVADRENSRLQIFNAQGEFLDQWEDVIRPTDICMDNEGVVYVSELCLRVSIFAPDGKLLARFGTQGKDKETALFRCPHTIAVDSQGSIYVGEVPNAYGTCKVDRGLRNLQKFIRQT